MFVKKMAEGPKAEPTHLALARNTHATRCRHPLESAAQPPNAHMSHHEDAGIGFTTFGPIFPPTPTAAVLPMPPHFNDLSSIPI